MPDTPPPWADQIPKKIRKKSQNARPITAEERVRICNLAARGYSQTEIAEEIGRSLNTVKRTLGLKRKSPDGQIPGMVQSEGRKLTYIENVQWAMASAGEYLRSKLHPVSCPNDSAWFLYNQAITEPKDFMAKACQIEARNDGGEAEKLAKRSSQASLKEIEDFLRFIEVCHAEASDCESAQEVKGIEQAADTDEVRPLWEGSGENVRED